MSKFLSGRQSNLNIGITSYTESKTVLQTTGKVGIGTTDAQQHSLFVVGSTKITDEVIVGAALSVNQTAYIVGVSTFKDRVIFDSTNSIQIPVGTTAERDIVGVAVTGQIRYNTELSSFEGYGPGGEWGSLGGVKDVDQDTYIIPELSAGSDDDTLFFYTGGNLSGTLSSTTGAIFNVDVGIGSTQPTANLDVLGQTELDDLNVSGVSTFTGAADFNGDLDVDGQTELDDLNVSGVSTFTGAIDANGDLDVDGHTELDDLNVSGVSTFASHLDINASIDVDGHTELDNLNVSGVSTFAGIGTFQSDLYVGGDLYVADDLVFDEFTARNASLTGNLQVAGVSTFNGNIDANGDLDVDGHTNLDNVSISGVTTFADNIIVNGDLDVDGRAELDTTNISETLNVIGVSTFASDLDINASIDVDGHTELDDLNVSGVSTFQNNVNVGSAITMYATSGIVSATYFYGDGSNLTGLTASQVGAIADIVEDTTPQLGGDLDVNGNDITGTGNVNLAGIITATEFVGDLTGTATTATTLETGRTFEITGDVVASPIIFDGTGNVSLAATIQPNSVGLGTDTTGDYVKSITGTANEVTVSVTSGEGSTPQIGLPDDVTIGQDLTVSRDLDVLRNLNVIGNITVGGTSATLFTSTLQVEDPDIILGIRTDAFGNDISTDNTANHGGIAIASTEGNPLVDLYVAGIETVPTTYKKIMWFKSGSFSGLGTDAWLSNYAIGIGSTQVPNGVRLAAGNVQVTENDVSVVRNINASGIATLPTIDAANATIDNLTFTSGTAITSVDTDLSSVSVSDDTLASAKAIKDYIDGEVSTINTTIGNIDLNFVGDTGTGAIDLDSETFTIAGTANEIETVGTGNTLTIGLPGSVAITTSLVVDSAVTITSSGIDAVGIISASRFVSDVTTGTAPLTVSSTTLVSNLNADLLDGQEGSYYLDYTNFVGIATNADKLDGQEGSYYLDYTNFVGIATNADKLDGQEGSYYTNASNINAGTIGDAYLPATISSDITGNAATATTATNLADGANITTGTISDARLPDLITSNINISSGISTVSQLVVGSAVTITSSGIDASSGIITALQFVGTASTASFATTAFTLNGTAEINLSVGTAVTATNIAGGDAGDIPYQSAANTTTFVDASSASPGQVLLWNGSTPSWENVSSAAGVFGGISVQDEGVTVGTASSVGTINFVGGNIQATATTGANGISTVTLSDTPTFDTLSVTGISTFTGAIDANGDLDVDGQTELDDLNVSGVSTFNSDVRITDDDKLRFGTASSGILQIYTNGTNSFFKQISGDLKYELADQFIVQKDTGDEPIAVFTADGSVELYYDNSKKFETTGFGVTVFGGLNVSGVSTFIGSIDANGDLDVDGQTELDDLNVSGVSTFQNNVNVGSAITMYAATGIVSATAFYGSGQNLSDIIAQKLSGVTIIDEGSTVGTEYQFTNLNFVGDSVTATGIGSTATINITSGIDAISISTNTTNQSQYVPYVTSFGSTTGLGATNSFVFNPFIGLLEAISFSGDGSRLSNTNGFSTSLSSDPTSPLYRIYKETRVLNVTAGVHTVSSDSDHDNLAFTKADTIVISAGSTFEVSSGTTFRTNIIDLFPADEDLDVTAQNLTVLGISTFSGDVTVNATVSAVDFNSTSDAKLKTNVKKIEDPLEKVIQIQGVSFNWIKDDRPSMGVIADEVQKVLPELVSDTDPKTVNYNGLIGLLIEVVKEQQNKIESLENRISKLE